MPPKPSWLTAMRTHIQTRMRSGRERMAAIVLWSRADDMTRFGISLPAGPGGTTPFGPSGLSDAARGIEAAGFESAWTFDSLGRGTLRADPLMALAVAATVTRTLELGTGVLQVPLRNPIELAQRALTVQQVSGGRFRFGVGAGSTAADFAALGFDFDGWVGSGARSSWRALREGIARFRGFGGKRAVVTNVRVALDSPAASPDGPDDPFDLRCPRDVARERLHRLREWGFDDIVLVPGRHEAEHYHELRELTQGSR